MKKIKLLLLALIIGCGAYAQNYHEYLETAKHHLSIGNKDKAVSCYNVYKSMTGQINEEFESMLNSKLSVDVKISKQYNVGDYYQDNKGNRGIIYTLDEAKEHGKIVSLNDVASDVKFSSKNRIKKLVDTSSFSDAAHNHTLIKRIDEWHKIFIGFKRCEEYGYGWKLPAEADLLRILNIPEVKNALLKYGGGLAPGSYMSSTYHFNKYDFIFNDGFFYDGIVASSESFLADDKIEHVRAIYEF